MLFSRKKFFDGYRSKIGALSQQQVDGLNRLLDSVERDPHIKDLRWFAYMLATVDRETAHTFHPIHEYGGKTYFIKRYGGQTRKGKELGNDTPEEGYFYAGKGDVQLTGEGNYEKAEDALREEYPELVADFEVRTGRKFDLTVGDQPNDEKDPMNAMDPAISYAIMSYGMRSGMFTGRRLSQFIYGTTANYKGARKIINGTDHDDEIAAVAKKFEAILKVAVESDAIREPLPPAPPVVEKPATEAVMTVVEAPAVPVQTVAPSVPVEDKVDAAIRTWSTRWAAMPAAAASAVAALWAWLTSSPVHLTVTLIVVAGVIILVYTLARQITQTSRHNANLAASEAEKQRQHEIQMALIAAAADKDKNTVALVPPAVEVGSPTEVTTDA